MDFNKLIEKEERKNKFNNNKLFKWWRKNDYKVYRVILFPIWICVLAVEKYRIHRYVSLTYSEEYCKKCIDKMLPKLITWYKEDINCFLISNCDDFGYIQFNDLCGIFNSYLEKHGFKKEIRFTRKFAHEVKEYIINNYQIDGYNKMTMSNYKEWKEAKEKFDWDYIPYSCDRCKGVVFYK